MEHSHYHNLKFKIKTKSIATITSLTFGTLNSTRASKEFSATTTYFRSAVQVNLNLGSQSATAASETTYAKPTSTLLRRQIQNNDTP